MAIKGYDSTGRQAAARERRMRVLDAAAYLFTHQGWRPTTLEQVAERAGLAPDVVARAFGGKAPLLMAAFRRASFGDYDNLQSAYAGLLLHVGQDVDQRLDAIVDFATGALRAMSGMVPALQQAADEDEAVRELVDLARIRRRTTSAEIVAMATRHGAAQPDAVETVYVLTSGETFLQYVEELSHSPVQYTAWLRRSIDRAVNG